MNNPNPYGSPYTQNSGQQIGASGLGLQIPTKSVLPNSLSPFAMDKKAVPGGGMPSMVGSNLSAVLSSHWHFNKLSFLLLYTTMWWGAPVIKEAGALLPVHVVFCHQWYWSVRMLVQIGTNGVATMKVLGVCYSAQLLLVSMSAGQESGAFFLGRDSGKDSIPNEHNYWFEYDAAAKKEFPCRSYTLL